MNIICFLTVRPDKLFYEFCKKLESDNYKVFICVDDNSHEIECENLIKIDNVECQNAGFKNTLTYFKNKNRAGSRDKALYYFCKNNINYDYIWFVEEDVFIPNEKTILNIDEKYPTGDLLCKVNNIKTNNDKWEHWSAVFEKCNIGPPYSHSMISAIRCSKKMIQIIGEHANKYKTLFVDEALFTTLAMQNNLDIKTISELSTIEYRKTFNEFLITNLYHPVKSIKQQYKYREILNKKSPSAL